MCPLLFPTLRFGAFIPNLWPWALHPAPPPQHPAPPPQTPPPPSRKPATTSTFHPMAAITTTGTAAAASSSFLRRRTGAAAAVSIRACHHRYRLACRAAEVSGAEPSAAPAAVGAAGGGASWVPVVPLAALPRGERR